MEVEHIDPRRCEYVCGLKNDYNEIIADSSYNNRKNNRFVPYRVNTLPAPVEFGDMGEFLVEGEWVFCEFGGDLWWRESNRIGNSHTRRPHTGHTHSEEWKLNNSEIHRKNWETRDKTQIRNLGKSKHKRNTEPGRRAAARTGHPHKRRHWNEEVYNSVKEAYLSRTGHHWGKAELARKHKVSEKTIDNMVTHIRKGKTFSDLVMPERRNVL